MFFFFFQAEDGIRDADVTGVQTCALPIFEGEPVAAGRDRASYVEVTLDAFAGCGADLVPPSVPDDRVAAVVEPVVREVELSPGRSARVLERNAGARERTCL